MAGGFDIDTAREPDAAAIRAVAAQLPDWFTPRGLEQIATDLRFQRAFVAREQGHVVGFLTWYVHGGAAWIGWMGVAPHRRRRGAGRALVDRLAAAVSPAGIAEIRVETLGDGVDYPPYAATRAFYRAIGFADLERVARDDPEWPEKLTLRRAVSAAGVAR